jgi:hypothetical protein
MSQTYRVTFYGRSGLDHFKMIAELSDELVNAEPEPVLQELAKSVCGRAVRLRFEKIKRSGKLEDYADSNSIERLPDSDLESLIAGGMDPTRN